MGINVKGLNKAGEAVAKKLFGIESVPKEEQTRMKNRAVKAASECFQELQEKLDECEKTCGEGFYGKACARLQRKLRKAADVIEEFQHDIIRELGYCPVESFCVQSFPDCDESACYAAIQKLLKGDSE